MRARFLALKFRLMQSSRFWKWRSFGQRFSSAAAALVVTALARIIDVLGVVRLVSAALVRTLGMLIAPALLLWFAQSVTHLRWSPFGVRRLLPSPVLDGLGWLSERVGPTLDTSTLLTATIGVAGTFVAVYFATVSFVISSSYRDATRHLRSQITGHPESRWYATLFTEGVAFAALTLFLPVLGHRPTHLTLVLGGLSAGLVVLSFGRIWRVLFQLLEPTALFPLIGRDLTRCLRRAERLGGRRWPSAVAAVKTTDRIRYHLQTLGDLTTLILDREYERVGERGITTSFDPRVKVALANIATFWLSYANRKSIASSLPGWNPTRPTSKDWFLASDSELGLALGAGTALMADEVTDNLWLERILAGLVERLLIGRGLRSLDHVLTAPPNLTAALASLGQFEEMRVWRAAVIFPAMRTVKEHASEVGAISFADEAAEMSPPSLSLQGHFGRPTEASAHNLADLVLYDSVAAALGLRSYADRVRDWLPSAPHAVSGRPTYPKLGTLVLEALANVRKAIRTERLIEGKRLTPDSAVTQLAARVLATQVIDELEEVRAFAEAELWPWVLTIGRCKSLAAGAVLSRAVELSAKYEGAITSIGQMLGACETVHIDDDDRWPNTDISQVVDKIRGLEAQLELPTAQLAATVDVTPDRDRPDHFGWAYYRAHEDLLKRVLERDRGDSHEYATKVGLLYWSGDLATRRLIASVRRHDQSVINAYVCEPHTRFLQLSGVALLLATIDDRADIFEPFEKVWRYRLASAPEASATLGRAAATIASTRNFFAITPGAILRQGIEMQAKKVLRGLGVPWGDFDYMSFGFEPGAMPERSLSSREKRLLRETRSGHFEGMFYSQWLRPAALASGATAPVELEESLPGLDFDLGGEEDV